jgi:cellulose synthase/poly-beta-1,6-N-acetylglucosamine synthase-like glycosyltransferase
VSESPLVSVIIPCKDVDDYVKECVKHCRQLDYERYEIILLPDFSPKEIDGVRVIPTGHTTPGEKRNVGIASSGGEFCAFIDSDAYPRRDWLSNAVKYFDDQQVAAVGGPGLTPEEDSLMQRAGGYVLSSFMVGGMSRRYKAARASESDDIHSCNFIARKAILKEAGGWNEKYWPGEDTLMCLAIKSLGRRLVEASDVVVYHHRRPLFAPHLKQVSRFGEHRGFFAKRFPGNSLKLTYFVPSLLVLFLLAGVCASFAYPFFWNVLVLALAAYLVLGLIAALLQVKQAKLLLSVWLGVVATHVVYGLSFLAGFVKRDLQR